jgi:hypothetical protein
MQNRRGIEKNEEIGGGIKITIFNCVKLQTNPGD